MGNPLTNITLLMNKMSPSVLGSNYYSFECPECILTVKKDFIAQQAKVIAVTIEARDGDYEPR